jgi:hypothetical protein
MYYSMKRMITLLLVRIVLVVSFQLFFVLLLSWDEARPWWPFSMIATEAACLIILMTLLKEEREAFSSIQLMPFETSIAPGKITGFLNGKHSENRFVNILLDILLFVALLLLLGFPAIVLNGFLSENIPVLRDTDTVGVLPNWALYLMIVLLPLTQACVEFPWFYGYIYPRLEAYFEGASGNPRVVASIRALSIVLIFFVLQAALIPLTLNPEYIMWRAIAFIPLLLVIGIVIRLVPRFMPGVNILHALMALNVVLEYWKFK